MRMLAHPMTRRRSTLPACADAFLSEARLCADWVEEQNVQKGIAPVTGVLLKECRERLCRRPMRRQSELQWLRRWPRRWAIAFGGFQSRDTMDVVGGQKKGLVLIAWTPPLGSRFRGPLGAKKDTPRRPRGAKRAATMQYRNRSLTDIV